MKIVFFLLSFFLFSSVLAQVDPLLSDSLEYEDKDTSEYSASENAVFLYEAKFYFSHFQQQVKTIDDPYLGLSSNYLSVAFIGNVLVSKYFSSPGLFAYSYLLPTRIMLNDSIKERLKGYSLRCCFLGMRFFERKHAGMFISGGINAGRIKLVNEEREKAKNPFINPCVNLVFRGTFSRLSLYAIVGADYDLSNKHWKKLWFRPRQKEMLPSFNQSGVTCSLGVRYIFMNMKYIM